MLIPHIDYFRNLTDITDPQFPHRLAEALAAVHQQSAITEQQGNLNANGQPNPPPNIQSVTATGANGWLHVAIQDQSAGLARGVEYFAEHSAFPDFRDSQIRPMGTSRQIDLPIGNATRYVRAYSAYPSSPASAHAYHGSQVAPLPVQGGGSMGPPAWLPSQGSGTDAAGVSGVGPGRLPKRTVESGVNWTGQQLGGPAGLLSSGAPVQPAGAAGLTSTGGGGGGTPSATEGIISACETLTSVAGTNTIVAVTATPYSALAANFLVRIVPANTNSGPTTLNVNSIGAKAVTKNGTTALSGGELVAGEAYVLLYDGTRFQIIGLMASMVSGDLTIATTGAGILATVNPDVGTFGDATDVAQVTVDGKGRITTVANVPIVFPGTTGFSGTVALAELTPTGANGSLTVANGLITAYTPPT